MKKEKKMKIEDKRSKISRRNFCKIMMGILLIAVLNTMVLFASEDNAPSEPKILDEPTPWQKGDPEPEEMKIPAVEPEQTSTEAPPCQPIDDDRPDQPSSNHVWVTGYWWWTNQTYKWVPGYWVVPPQENYVYLAGYWAYGGKQWVYHRGGWAKVNTTTIVVYPRPRPLLTAFVITAPRRIIRRHRLWRHFPARRVVRHVNRRVKRRQTRRIIRRRSRR